MNFRSLFAFLSAGVLCLGVSSAPVFAVEPVSFTLEDLTNRIELRRGTWIGLKAEVALQFNNAENQKASCEGILLYHRLDEAIRLECLNQKKELIFIFKTTDRDFELYLPAHRTLYQGNIFSLEDSPAIESHLRAWDLYRAFKPMLLPQQGVALDQAPEGFISVKVTEGNESPVRSLLVSNQGDIVSEIYYGLNEKPVLEIKRNDFHIIIPSSSEFESAFPHQILIVSNKETANGTELLSTEFLFKKVDFSAELEEKDFELNLTEDTRTIALEDHP